jgi:hypothetical protein
MNKESKILTREPKLPNRPVEPINENVIEYYMFFKSVDNSSKIDKKNMQELLQKPLDNDADIILEKNIKIMLSNIEDLGSIERAV